MKNLLAILFVLMAVIPVKAEDGGESENPTLPPVVSLSYIYLDSDSESNDNASDGTRVRLFFSDTEGVDYIILEMLMAGSRLPNKALISDISKGYFDTTIWHNTTFTAVAYNNADEHTRGIPLFVPVRPTADVVEVEEPALEVVRMLIYNLDGSIVFDGSPVAFSIDNLSSGLYIKKEILSDGGINTAKIIVR